MKKKMKNKTRLLSRITAILALVIIAAAVAAALTGCTEADRVSHNVSVEADNFNIFRRLAVINDRTDKVIFELDGISPSMPIQRMGSWKLYVKSEMGAIRSISLA